MPSTITTAEGGDEVERVGDAGVGAEVVDRALDGETGGEDADVREDELGLEGVGMVEVALVAGVEGEVGEVAVVEVEGEEGGVELRGELAGEGGLAGAGTAGYGEYCGGFRRWVGWEHLVRRVYREQ